MLSIPFPPPFDVPYVGPRPIFESEDHLIDKELIFLSHLSFDGDSFELINQPYSNLDIPPINLPPINQDEPLDDLGPDDFLIFELYGHACSSNLDDSLFLHEYLDL